MVRDAGDIIVTPFEPYILLAAATSPGSLVASIKTFYYPMQKARIPGPISLPTTRNRLPKPS
jgi:hypothetical protein